MLKCDYVWKSKKLGLIEATVYEKVVNEIDWDNCLWKSRQWNWLRQLFIKK